MSQDDLIVEQLIGFLASGSAVIIQTDTVYGILALREDLIIKAKKRLDSDKKIVRFIHKESQMEKTIPDTLQKLIDRYWPGSLTIIYRGVGYRCPNSHYILKALKKLNQHIYASSANISGQPTAKSIGEAKQIFKNCGVPVKFIEIPGGKTASDQPSTVYDYDKDRVLREGQIKKEDILTGE